jgi:hypothetical protein
MWFNLMIVWLLKSPLHGMISKGVMLVSVTGRKSGRMISTPTNYLRDGNTFGSWLSKLRNG